jgi:hypothetical protein
MWLLTQLLWHLLSPARAQQDHGKLKFHKSPATTQTSEHYYSVFHRFRQAKFANGGSNLSSSQFFILPQLPQKMKLVSKVVKIDPKIIVWLPKI